MFNDMHNDNYDDDSDDDISNKKYFIRSPNNL